MIHLALLVASFLFLGYVAINALAILWEILADLFSSTDYREPEANIENPHQKLF